MEFNQNIPKKFAYFSEILLENHNIKSKIPTKENITFTQKNSSHFHHYPLNAPKNDHPIDFFKEGSSSIITPLLSLSSTTPSVGGSSSNNPIYHPNESLEGDLLNLNHPMPYAKNNAKVEFMLGLPNNRDIGNFCKSIPSHSGSKEAPQSQVQNKSYETNHDNFTDMIKGQWSNKEDRALVELVKCFGEKNWSEIAKSLKSRTRKQCRERWNNHLNPNIRKDSWSEEEEKQLIEAHKELGNKWTEIAKKIPGRSENTIKNHWYYTKRRLNASKQIRKYNTSKGATIFLQDYIKQVIRVEETENEQNKSKVITKTRDESTPFHVGQESLKGSTSFAEDKVGCSMQHNVQEYDVYIPAMPSSNEMASNFAEGVNKINYEVAIDIWPEVQQREEMDLMGIINRKA